MSDKVDNLVLEHLRSIRGTLSDHGERLGRIELRLSAMEQTLGSLYTLSGSDRETLSSLARRIEQRLDLASSDA
ncbi:MAG: hypothetical protein KFB96_18745 [Thiocapsa sp.]|uniref:hypothetical protein n=1 Tax=Thiocapsa sp. TaxID=2024551 RepID=UPI001BCAB878|nr:hypothetical protein [Thiocapsa sp.]QVL47706.1 MAG: hypothetical protein KFB96_18745 [Thiocapsa sp.]